MLRQEFMRITTTSKMRYRTCIPYDTELICYQKLELESVEAFLLKRLRKKV